ncbi:MAG: energy transducer TonB [Thermoanaerobaculia bacterium]
MIKSASAIGLALFLTSSLGSAAEIPAVLPAPTCLTPDGQPLPEAKDPIQITALSAAERPVPVSTPRPRWSRKALDCQPQGKVWVQMLITTKGEVCAAGLFQQLPPSCDKVGTDAIEAARKWKFRPGQREGSPIAVLYILGFDFKPQG